MALDRTRMSSESSPRRKSSGSLCSRVAGSSAGFDHSSISEAARDVASLPSSSSEPPNETTLLALKEGHWSSQVKSTEVSPRCRESETWDLGRHELTLACLLRPATPPLLPSRLVTGGGREWGSMRGGVTSLKKKAIHECSEVRLMRMHSVSILINFDFSQKVLKLYQLLDIGNTSTFKTNYSNDKRCLYVFT